MMRARANFPVWTICAGCTKTTVPEAPGKESMVGARERLDYEMRYEIGNAGE